MDLVHDDLTALADVVASEEFKARQDSFYSRFCHEFVHDVDESTSNKLSYTTIHNDYCAKVEEELAEKVGAERMANIMANVEQYINAENHEKSREIAGALELLSSMADFEAFKQTMLLKKEELASSSGGGGGMAQGGGTIIDIDDELNKCADLLAASAATGWRVLTESEDMSVWIKDGAPGKRFIRGSISMDLPPHLCAECLMMFGPEAVEWNDKISFIEVISDFGPDDKVMAARSAVPAQSC